MTNKRHSKFPNKSLKSENKIIYGAQAIKFGSNLSVILTKKTEFQLLADSRQLTHRLPAAVPVALYELSLLTMKDLRRK